jgi:hypothetical protein
LPAVRDFSSIPFYDLIYRITEGDKVIGEEEITGYSYRPAWNVLQRELVDAGFTQAEGAEGLLAWRLALTHRQR